MEQPQARTVRDRPRYALLILATLLIGLASRRLDRFLPWPLHKNTGDVLWATMVFFLFALLWPRLSTLRLILTTLLFSVCIELAKLLKWPWLVHLRATTAGHLVFGSVFSWSNLICYLIGSLLGSFIDAKVL